jgi:outer membrane protein assembly factor BamB
VTSSGLRAVRPAMAAASRAGAVAVLAAAGLAACTSPPSPASHAGAAASTPARRPPPPSPGTPSRPASAFRLLPARGPGHLAPGSDPRALPGGVLIADEGNRRLLLVDPYGRTRWQFPGPGALGPGQRFGPPDDAFVSPDGRSIVATQEENQTISVIDTATGRITRRYGHPGVPGSGPGYYYHPDDAMLLPGGQVLVADILNCRILLLSARRITRQLGSTSTACTHEPPRRFAQPNGAFPLHDGHYLITEILGDWVDEMSLDGHVYWSAHPPGVRYPSDANEVSPGRYLVADYSDPGQVVIFTRTGQLVWRFRPAGAAALNHPSLALPLPNGNILVNDDYNDRVIVISPKTNRIVWQYGHDGVPGRAAGYLDNPDGVDLAPPDSLLMAHAATMGRP